MKNPSSAGYLLQDSETNPENEKEDSPEPSIPVPPDQELPAPIKEPPDPDDRSIGDDQPKPKMIV